MSNRPIDAHLHLVLRPMLASDQDLLWDALRDALWDPPDAPRRPRSALDRPSIAIYAAGWGRAGDHGFLASVHGQPVGAAWGRRFEPMTTCAGFIAPEFPVLAISVKPDHQGQGIGRRLLERLLQGLTEAGIGGASLSVHPRNLRARHLYRYQGFQQTGVRENGYLVMYRRLAVM